jgi:sterol desaturase/sphingolipid hydroxylase (fatty acid hydroxylase superfamily)
LILGVMPQTVLIYEIVFEAATQFHHSNLRMPVKLETMLGKIFVTPRMHGIHHSIIKVETDSNYSVIFSFWDRLHRTLRLSVHQDALIIGVPSYQNADELTGWFLLKLPFTKIRSWTKTFLTRTNGVR